jgi:uncharacterized protein (UPF0276 family)
MFAIADQMVGQIARAATLVIGNVATVLRQFLNGLRKAMASVMRIMVVTANTLIDTLVDLTGLVLDGVNMSIDALVTLVENLKLPTTSEVHTALGGSAISGGLILGVLTVI